MPQEKQSPDHYISTKTAADLSMRTSTLPKPVVKPSMYSEGNIEERLQTYGVPDAIRFT